MINTPIDLDCWEFYIGVLYGDARALGANSEYVKAIDWVRDHVECGPVETNLDRMLKEVPAPKIGRPLSSFKPINNIDEEEKAPRKKREPKTDNGIAASEPPRNSLGIPEWGIDSEEKKAWEQLPIDEEDDCDDEEQAAEPPVPHQLVAEPVKLRGWTPEQEADLIRWTGEGKNPGWIAKETGRGYQGVYQRIGALKAAGKC